MPTEDTYYARIPPRKARKNRPAPPPRYSLHRCVYRMDAEPDVKPLWYKCGQELADELDGITVGDDEKVFEVITEKRWLVRMENIVKITVISESGDAENRAPVPEFVEEDAEDDEGRVDVGKTKPKAKPKKTRRPRAKAKRPAPKAAPKAKAPKAASPSPAPDDGDTETDDGDTDVDEEEDS